MLEFAIYNLLKNDATVYSMTGDRIHHVQRPQGESIPIAGPTVVIQAVFEDPDRDLDAGLSGVTISFIKVTCLAQDLGACLNLKNAVIEALDSNAERIAADVCVQLLEAETISPVPFSPDAGDEQPTHGRSIDFRGVWCIQAQP